MARRPRHREEEETVLTVVPKVELHLHLEGAAPPALIRQIAHEKRRGLEGIFDADGRYTYRDFHDFLRVYEAATGVLDGPRDYARLTAAVADVQASEGAIYTEVFVCPDFCGGGDIFAWRDYIAEIRDAAETAAARHGTILRVIATAVRHLGQAAARRAARAAAETAGDFVVGFGLAGDEHAGAPQEFAWAFDCAREAGLGLTAHAGEWRGPDDIARTLDALRVSRLGHGVRAIDDLRLTERLARDGIVLEVCPGSNLALGVYRRLADHPIDRLRRAGVPVTVSTDDPPFFHTSLTAEYAALSRTFGWDAATFTEINRIAAGAAFCDAATRDAILKTLKAPNATEYGK